MSMLVADHFAWTDERAALITRLHLDGCSASEIVKQLGGGVSRSAVIGKLRRLGVVRTSSPQRPSKAAQVLSPVRPTPKGRGSATASVIALNLPVWAARKDAQDPPSREVQPDADDLVLARPWETRERGECNWPFGPAEATLSCCRPVDRSGLCDKHAQIAFPAKATESVKRDRRGLERLFKRFG